ncbi:acyl-CoA N-acyltransferase [Xylariaceae sp. FL1272]|nr:acyl-CoA N-acyltransferase [Xylariaceae sp. FL1272]
MEKGRSVWRELTLDDINALMQVANVVHADLPERAAVFAERVKLFPRGNLALVDDNDELRGYTISHPIYDGNPPALDSLLGEITPDADQYYIHDVCILPEWRGYGLAAEGIKRLLHIANDYPTTTLVSVYGTASFWGRFGFASPAVIEERLARKVHGYGDGAVYMVRSKED